MTEQRNAEADLAVCQAATPGPWVLSTSGYAVRLVDDDGEQMEVVVDLRGNPRFSVEQMVDNGLFIALAREALPWWINHAQESQEIIDAQGDEVQRLAAEVARLQGVIDGMAARIAHQSDALSRTAEKCPLARLTEWAATEPGREFQLYPRSLILFRGAIIDGPTVIIHLADMPMSVGKPGRCTRYLGDSATHADGVDAALKLWEELHGE